MKLQNTPQVALVCALTTGDECVRKAAIDALQIRFGPMVERGELYAFDEGGYYASEMGFGLKKQLFCFTTLVSSDTLYAQKMAAIDIEHALADTRDGESCRRANIDPGLLSIESLVLSTTKRVGHRICIGTGIWAETTLLYQKGAYRPLPWTYLDYQSDGVQQFLLRSRQWLRSQRGSAVEGRSGRKA